METRYCWVSFMVCVFVLLAGAVVGDDGADYLDAKQFQVQQMANQAIQNYNRQCEFLATCNNPSNCSHDVCAPLLGDREGLRCMTVYKSVYCSLPGTNNSDPCTKLNLDYRRGYVRVAATTNLESVDTMLSICSQRELDPLMKFYAMLNTSVVTRFFFAPMDGSWRVIPGSAQTGDDCRHYEPRLRTWFRTATSVVKVVTVLIDAGASMNSVLQPSFGVTGTMLEAAKNIARQLLTTLSADDHVNFVVFNSTGAYQLNPQAILVQDHNSTEQPELQPLLDDLKGLTVESNSGQSNLTAAILAALPNFESNPSAAKVILVITDGVFATKGNVTLPSASSLSGVKVFLYKLPQNNDNDIYLANSTLIQQLCTVGGHFEPILKNLENPLLALNKFFSYTANLKRIETGGVPQYSNIYQDFEQIGGNIITVSQPAFSAAGNLIGVAGLTIYIELLGNLTNPVKNALVSRVTGYSAPTVPIVLTAANCSVVNETTREITAQPCGGNSAYYAGNGGLCMQTDFRSTIQDLACCGASGGACSVPTGSGNSHQKGAIAGIAIGSVVGLLLLVSLGLCACCGYKHRQRKRARRRRITEEFPGDRAGRHET